MKNSQKQVIEDFKEFLKEFADESDRAIVVLTAAKVDYLLKCVIQNYLLPSPSKSDEFFESNGPGSTFSNRITLSYRLGLIDADMAQTLNLMRRIRNDFAHEASGCALDAGSHKDRVRAMASKYRTMPYFTMFRDMFFEGHSTSRADYMTVTGFLIIRLEYLLDDMEQISDTKQWSLVTAQMKSWRPKETKPPAKKIKD